MADVEQKLRRLHIATPKQVCAQCGARHAPMKCQRCVEMQLASPAYYCGTACQAKHWPTHRQFHRAAKKQGRLLTSQGDTSHLSHLSPADLEEAGATGAITELEKLNTMAYQMNAAGNFAKAAKLCRKAINLNPDSPAAYGNLGDALKASSDHIGAARAFLQAKDTYELCGDLGSEWAQASVGAIQYLMVQEFRVSTPPWWNDVELLELTARIVELMPDYAVAHRLRGTFLSMGLKAAPRSAEQLREACRSYKRAAVLYDDIPENKERMLEKARDCIRRSLALGVGVGAHQ